MRSNFKAALLICALPAMANADTPNKEVEILPTQSVTVTCAGSDETNQIIQDLRSQLREAQQALDKLRPSIESAENASEVVKATNPSYSTPTLNWWERLFGKSGYGS